jgi:hypothetical protein
MCRAFGPDNERRSEGEFALEAHRCLQVDHAVGA